MLSERARRRGGFLILGVILVSASPALAQPRTDPVAADYMFREARKAAAAGDYPKACPMFAESLRLDPGAGTRMNLADCEEHTGKIASAWEHWREALDEMRGKMDSRSLRAQRRIAALEKRLPRLTLKLDAAAAASTDAKVERDGVEIGAATLGLPVPVDPGVHAIVVHAPRHQDRKYTIDVKEGQLAEIVVGTGVATPLAPARVATPVHEPPPTTSASSGGRTAGFALLGVGGIGIAVGAVTGVMALGKKSLVQDHCSADPGGGVACRDAAGVDAASSGRSLATLSTVAFVAGAVAVGVGVFLVLIRHDGTKTVTAVGTSVVPGGGALTWARTF